MGQTSSGPLFLVRVGSYLPQGPLAPNESKKLWDVIPLIGPALGFRSLAAWLAQWQELVLAWMMPRREMPRPRNYSFAGTAVGFPNLSPSTGTLNLQNSCPSIWCGRITGLPGSQCHVGRTLGFPDPVALGLQDPRTGMGPHLPTWTGNLYTRVAQGKPLSPVFHAELSRTSPGRGAGLQQALPVGANCSKGDITSWREAPGHSGVGRVEEGLLAEGRRTW